MSENRKVSMLLDHKLIWKISYFQISHSNETKVTTPLVIVFTTVNVIKAYDFRI